jgi:hypothetical protein
LTALASDDFNRADSSDNHFGSANWSSTGSFNVSTNQALQSTGVDAGCDYIGITWPADQWCQATWARLTTETGSGDGNGLEVRSAPPGGGPGGTWYAVVVDTTNDTEIGKRVSGTYTTLSTINTSSWAVNDVIYLEVQGNTITVKKNGITIMTVTDSAITAAGSPGFNFSSGGGATGAIFDDWSGGDFNVASLAVDEDGEWISIVQPA